MEDYREFTQRNRRARQKRKRRKVLLILLVVLVACAAAFGGYKLLSSKLKPADSKPASSQAEKAEEKKEDKATEAKPVDVSMDVLAPLPNMEGTSDSSIEWNTIGPVEQTLDYTIHSPDYRMVALPELGIVDSSYFNTATFVGDSLTQGLELYNTGLPNAHYCAYKGIGPNSIVNGATVTRANGTSEIALDALAASQPDYVYVLLGTNTLIQDGSEDSFLAYYGRMIDMMKDQLLDGVKIYIQAIPPVSPEVCKTARTSGLRNERLRSINSMLAQLAMEKECYFVDLQECLADEDGNLKDEYAAADGIHMNPSGYQAWVDYLSRHVVYDKRNPYLYGSPYYIS